MHVLLVLPAVLVLLINHAEGLTCLKCDGVPQPRICNKVVECYDGESCSVEKMLNDFGEYVYNLGCLSNTVCSNFTSSLHSPTITCSECCTSADLCNSKGCGEPGYPSQRGPICYNCPLHTETGRCHDIEFCSPGEVCNIVGKNVFSDVVYTSRCVSKHACKATEESHVSIIGKRDIVTGKRSHAQHTCDSCCSVDICNKNCSTARQKNDPCQSNPCNNGRCSSNGENFKCECLPGYTGSLCENDINECASQPCVHGSCTDRVNGYNCICSNGYNGLNCETDIDECASQPCIHGSCTDMVDGYNCTCLYAYRGLNCETDLDECSSNPCYNGTCIDGVGNYSCACNGGFGGTHCERTVSDCLDVLRYGGKTTSGIYTVRTWKSHQQIQVFCDMTTDGGGWTVFQNRFNGSVNFYKNFNAYEYGFGNLKTEFWLGLRYIEELASQGITNLRIDLEAANGTTGFETYGNFSLSPGPAYTLHLGPSINSSRITYSNSFGSYHNGYDFSTYDHDADSDPDNCAQKYHGAWWYNNCVNVNLNGKYLTPGTNSGQSMYYYGFLGVPVYLYHNTNYVAHISLKSNKMMIRRK